MQQSLKELLRETARASDTLSPLVGRRRFAIDDAKYKPHRSIVPPTIQLFSRTRELIGERDVHYTHADTHVHDSGNASLHRG